MLHRELINKTINNLNESKNEKVIFILTGISIRFLWMQR